MTTITKITFVCNGTKGEGCGRKFAEEGETTNRHTAMVAAQKEGWRWISSATQLCADHAQKPVVAKKAKTAKTGKGKVSVKVSGKGKKVASKPGKKVVPAGQSIGKFARSAKVGSAPAAE